MSKIYFSVGCENWHGALKEIRNDLYLMNIARDFGSLEEALSDRIRKVIQLDILRLPPEKRKECIGTIYNLQNNLFFVLEDFVDWNAEENIYEEFPEDLDKENSFSINILVRPRVEVNKKHPKSLYFEIDH